MGNMSVLGRDTAIAVLFVLCVFAVLSVSILAVDSLPIGEFNVTPDSISINWTNNYRKNITVGILLGTDVILALDTRSEWSTITSRYSQESRYPNASYAQYWWGAEPGCFHSGIPSPDRDNPLGVYNASGSPTNTTDPMDHGETGVFELRNDVLCPPGRYYGNYTVVNESNSTERASIYLTLDIPISTDNVLSASSGSGSFRGSMAASSPYNHSYWFNTSNITNATAVAINLATGYAGLDVFLFDNSGNLKAQSARTDADELFRSITPGQYWEIIVYGDVGSGTDYNGNIYFSTLEFTDTSSPISSFDFGTLEVTNLSIYNFSIINKGNLTPTPVESMELYHLNMWPGSGHGNFTFMVTNASVPTKVQAFVNWTKDAAPSNYTISLYRPDRTLVGSSTDNHINAKFAGGRLEEYVETTSNMQAGLWEIKVVDNTLSHDPYNVSARFWVEPSEWLSSNYTSREFNTTGQPNSTQDFHVNMTIPATALDGLHGGKLRYSGSLFEMPFTANITTAVFMVNDTFQASTTMAKENIGFDRIGSDCLQLSVPMNNTGSQTLNFGPHSNTSFLTHSSGSRINWTFSYPSSIVAGGSDTIDINLTIDRNTTNDTEGIYTGWVYLNATNARPYQYYNLTVEVNLTSKLVIDVTNLFEGTQGFNWISQTANATNGTIMFNVYFQNGTDLNASGYELGLGDFAVWINEENASKRVPSSGSFSLDNWTVHTWEVDRYKVNFTVPAEQIGGFYRGYAKASTTINGKNLTGTGSKYPLIINDTGIYMGVAQDFPNSVYEGRTTYYNVSVINYGPKTATGRLTLLNCTHGTERAYETNCGSTHPDLNYFDMSITGNGTEPCWFWFRFDANNVSENKRCYFTIESETDAAFHYLNPSLLIYNLVPEEDVDEFGPAGAATCNTDSDCASNYYCDGTYCRILECEDDEYIEDHACVPHIYRVNITAWPRVISIGLGGSNVSKVTVSNTGTGTMTVKFDATLYDGLLVEVGPSAYSLDENESNDFTVTINVTENATSGNHTGTFKAWMSTNTSVYDTEIFTLVVIPTAEREVEINVSFAASREDWNNLTSIFDAIKASGLVSEANLSLAELLINESEELLAEIERTLAAGDYSNVEPLVNRFNSKLDRIRRELDVLSEEQGRGAAAYWTNVYFWIIVGVVIIGVVGLVIYMLMPAEGFHIRRGFRPSQKEHPLVKAHKKAKEHAKGLHEKIKDILSRIKEKFKRKKEISVAKYRYKYKG